MTKLLLKAALTCPIDSLCPSLISTGLLFDISLDYFIIFSSFQTVLRIIFAYLSPLFYKIGNFSFINYQ